MIIILARHKELPPGGSMRIIIFFALLTNMTSAAADLFVHEWGTFTSFVGADGKPQMGMHEEEEVLPSFVYGFQNPQSGMSLFDQNIYCGAKIPCDLVRSLESSVIASNSLPKNPRATGITQKMETPVIYFYGDEGQRISVTINFPQGIISQYYPKASSYFPSYDDVTTLGPSQFNFDLLLKSRDFIGTMPRTTADSVWNPSRNVNANTIDINGQNEKFIFYRGVGDFDAKITVTNDGHSLTMRNRSQSPITQSFIIDSDGKTGAIRSIGEVAETKTATFLQLEERLPFNQYVERAKSMIADALVKDGLYRDEAIALVNTWEHSYFKSPGFRVLYIVPRRETDRILPLTLSPAPTSLVRTLVGRVEIMTPAEEEYLLKLLAQNISINNGRFHEPKLRRLLDMARANPEKYGREMARTIENILENL